MKEDWWWWLQGRLGGCTTGDCAGGVRCLAVATVFLQGF
jgi:hypothetical protein